MRHHSERQRELRAAQDAPFKKRQRIRQRARQDGHDEEIAIARDVKNDRVQQRPVERYRKYGIEPGDIHKMLAAQDERCAGCGEMFGDDTPYVIDHDHAGGFGNKFAVRGLLCHTCNVALSRHMTAKTLRALADYLERFTLGDPPSWH